MTLLQHADAVAALPEIVLAVLAMALLSAGNIAYGLKLLGADPLITDADRQMFAALRQMFGIDQAPAEPAVPAVNPPNK